MAIMISGLDVDNINEQIDLNLKDAMAVFGIGL